MMYRMMALGCKYEFPNLEFSAADKMNGLVKHYEEMLLVWAAYRGNLDMVRMFLDAGLFPLRRLYINRNMPSACAIEVAFDNGRGDIAIELISRLPDVKD